MHEPESSYKNHIFPKEMALEKVKVMLQSFLI